MATVMKTSTDPWLIVSAIQQCLIIKINTCPALTAQCFELCSSAEEVETINRSDKISFFIHSCSVFLLIPFHSRVNKVSMAVFSRSYTVICSWLFMLRWVCSSLGHKVADGQVQRVVMSGTTSSWQPEVPTRGPHWGQVCWTVWGSTRPGARSCTWDTTTPCSPTGWG